MRGKHLLVMACFIIEVALGLLVQRGRRHFQLSAVHISTDSELIVTMPDACSQILRKTPNSLTRRHLRREKRRINND